MNKKLEQKLSQLPAEPGVYLYKDARGSIIYVGKAAVLKNRVRQYFHKGRPHDTKTSLLIQDISDVEWITVESEIDALFLEAELVRRYMPKYNILLRDDKSAAYIRITFKSDHPTVSVTRRPLDDGADYFGPYFNVQVVRRALHSLRKVFAFSTHTTIPRRACLQYHLGLCPGLEEGKTTPAEYRKDLKKLIQYIKGNRVALLKELEADMKRAAASKQFERATQIRNKLFALKGLSKQIVFSDTEFLDASRDEALFGLKNMLGLTSEPRRIEGYDISHMQGTDTVASMVVFTNGIPEKAAYRKFKSRVPGNNDFAHMHEVITRRFSPRNRAAWPKPDLILIDGGKGQLDAALRSASEAGITVPMIGLAKREEEIVVHEKSAVSLDAPSNAIVKKTAGFTVVLLPVSSHIVKLLQRVRDESHRFAVSYHSSLKQNRQKSKLEDIPGIGPQTRKKLLKHFGSVKGIAAAPLSEVSKLVGVHKATQVRAYTEAESQATNV